MFAQIESDVCSATGCIFLGLLSGPPNFGHSLSAPLINAKQPEDKATKKNFFLHAKRPAS